MIFDHYLALYKICFTIVQNIVIFLHCSDLQYKKLKNNVKYRKCNNMEDGESVDQEEKSQKRWLIFSVIALTAALVIFAGSYLLVRNRVENKAGPAPSQIIVQIINEMHYSDLAEVSSAQLSKHYSIPDGVISASSLYMSKSSDNASELVCFQLTDKSKLTELQTAVAEHINSKAAGFKSLNPTQYNALKNATVTQNGKYVFVSVGSNSTADAKLFNEILK